MSNKAFAGPAVVAIARRPGVLSTVVARHDAPRLM